MVSTNEVRPCTVYYTFFVFRMCQYLETEAQGNLLICTINCLVVITPIVTQPPFVITPLVTQPPIVIT